VLPPHLRLRRQESEEKEHKTYIRHYSVCWFDFTEIVRRTPSFPDQTAMCSLSWQLTMTILDLYKS